MMVKGPGIRTKIRLIIVGASTVVLALACVAFYLLSDDVLRSNKLEQLDSICGLVAANAKAPLFFDMRDDAEVVLKPVVSDEQVIGCALFDAHGELFAAEVGAFQIRNTVDDTDQQGVVRRPKRCKVAKDWIENLNHPASQALT